MNQQNVNPSGLSRRGVTTRSQDNLSKIGKNMQTGKGVNAAPKRKADDSPANKTNNMTKRLAFGDLTNNASKSTFSTNGKKGSKGKPQAVVADKYNIKPPMKLADLVSNARGALKPTKAVTKSSSGKVQASAANIADKNVVSMAMAVLLAKDKLDESAANKVKQRKASPAPKLTTIIKSDELAKKKVDVKHEVIDIFSPAESTCSSSSGSSTCSDNTFPPDVIIPKRDKEVSPTTLMPRVPANVIDFDKENINDPCQVSIYAMDIFNYMRERESVFKIHNYMASQFCLTTNMRALLVDWMVEVQETFELNHETLYLAVKLVDTYLSKVTVAKETLQLIGAASIFIASKFDERMPPLVDDFLYICDGAYTHDEMIKAEMNVVKLIGFDLGIPLSYRFLRRFARCAKVTMPILTLARYILEYSLMEYQFVTTSDSLLAAASLYLALRMKDISDWTPTLEYYTNYKLTSVIKVSEMLNNMLHRQPKNQLSTVRNKYSHKIFFEVAKSPLLSNTKLLAVLD